MALQPGQTLAHYRIERKIGEGGMGEVWAATDTRLNRQAAIKALPTALAAEPERLARFTEVISSDTAGSDGREVRVGGILTSLRETRTRRGAEEEREPVALRPQRPLQRPPGRDLGLGAARSRLRAAFGAALNPAKGTAPTRGQGCTHAGGPPECNQQQGSNVFKGEHEDEELAWPSISKAS